MAKYVWHTTDFKGVRYREHATRKVLVGVVKYPDKYFAIRYQVDGQRIEEGLGWSSDPEKWTAEKAFAKLVSLKEAAKNCLDAPTRLQEERQRNAEEKRRREEEQQRLEAERKQFELENITAEKYFEETYFPTVKTHRKRPERICDEQHFRIWLSPVVGQKPLKDVSPFDLERVKRAMQAKERTPRMIQYVFATFRQIWNMARRDKIVSGDSPTKSVKLPKIDNKRFRYLTKNEADQLLDALKKYDKKLFHMATISLYTGMRSEEVLSLRWSDVDKIKGHIRIGDPKNSESRYAFISEPIKIVLQEMEEQSPDSYMFLNAKGNQFEDTPSGFRTVVTKLGFNKGITDKLNKVCFHTLRHSFGSWLAESGVDLYTIGKLMGHKTATMTARYAHLGPNKLRNAAVQLENIKNDPVESTVRNVSV